MPETAENIKKVAVIMDGQQTQFLALDQDRPLAAIIRDLCDEWALTNPDDFSLQFNDINRHGFITERNRVEIMIGNVLQLTFSPAKTAEQILYRLQNGSQEEKGLALKQLTELATDSTFAQEFINKKGLQLIINTIEGGTCTGEGLAYTLKAFVELMDHSIVSWDVLDPAFIKTVSESINMRKGDACILQSALEIMENIVLHSVNKYSLVEQAVTPVNLIQHLQSSNPDIQKNAIALINALFLKADPEKRKRITENLQSKSIRNVILNNVIRGSSSIGTEMAHQLYVLQSLMFNLLEGRRSTEIDINDQATVKDILNLRKIAFDSEPDPNPIASKRQSHARDFKKLGFQDNINPALDFTEVPPGILALDNIVYFAKMHAESFTKVVLENSCRSDDHDLPFAHASIALTNTLCEILKVGEPPADEGQVYQPMFFTHERPFEEFFCICIQLLNKTWKEMKATSADFIKVLSVVKEQITRALERQPLTFDLFRHELSHLTYAEITRIWTQERRNKEDWESHSRPIVELREKIKPEIIELIKEQRLYYLVGGTQFTKYSSRGTRMKDKFWYCRLSPNHKVFHYGDCEETLVPSIEQLQNKLAVVDIKGIYTGKDCPHIKDRGKKSSLSSLAFSIILEEEVGEMVNFIAPSDVEYNLWTDGINALMGGVMTSELMKQDLETLLTMEIKLRLLDTEGITIPETPPPIPAEPANYDFAYNM